MKQWKGNSRSVRSMIGIGYNNDRPEGDFYSTDQEAVRLLIKEFAPAWGSYKDFSFWEPACGSGNISKVLEAEGLGHPVISTDLYDRGYGTPGVDFLRSDLPDGVRVIITNPPYSLADEFVLHAMEILPWNGIYLALQNLSYLAGQKRYREIYEKGFCERVYVFPHRINCYKNGVETKQSSPVNYGWFMYCNNHTPYCNDKSFDYDAFNKQVEQEEKDYLEGRRKTPPLRFYTPSKIPINRDIPIIKYLPK